MEKQKLIYVESKALFSPSEVSDKAIVFIKDTKEIWTHGVYFSCSGTWATPITLSLTGDTTGSVSIDGSGNASIATTTTYLSGTTGINDANNAANTQSQKIAYYPRIGSSASNLFAVGNNANAILSLNVHDYSYTHLLGFSSNGNIYHRRRSAGTWETSWKAILNSSNYTNFLDSVYLKKSGGTMTGALNFANNTWNKVGDDAYMGDCNVAGMIGIKGSNADTPGFAMYNNSGTLLGKLYASGSDLYWSGIKLLTSTGSAQEAYLAWGGQNLHNSSSPIDTALVPALGANRLSFLNPDAITIEYSRDGGATWVDYGASDASKVTLFITNRSYPLIYLGKDSTLDTSIDRTSYRLRVTLSLINSNLYCQFVKFMIHVTDYGNAFKCTLLGRRYSDVQNNVDTWVTFLDVSLSGWSGWNTINHPAGITIPHTGHYGQIRFDFYITRLGTYGYACSIQKILGFAPASWLQPSNMAAFGDIYNYDWQLNVTFPAQVTATRFSGNLTGNVTGNLTGNADTASKWATARTITLTGDVTGSVTLDGSSNVTLTTTTSGTATTTFLKCPDKRNSYPALIVTSGGNIGAAFMSASKLGLSDGDYYDALILRGYGDSSGGNENALLFSKNTSSVYHSQYKFGSTTTWGTMYKFLDSGNYTNYTIGYAKSNLTSAGSVGVINDGKLYYNSALSFAKFVQHDNSGRYSYELIAELTNYGTGTNTSYITYGISGFMWAYREGNGANSCSYSITAIVNVGPAILQNMLRVSATTNVLIPFVVKYNDKYYIALRKNSSSTTFYFMGFKHNLLTTTIIVDDASLIEEVQGPGTETSTASTFYNNGNPQPYLHSGNYYNYALPLYGGVLTGKLTMQANSLVNLPTINRTDAQNTAGIRFLNSLGYLGAIGMNTVNGCLYVLDASANLYPVLDSRNYNNYAAAKSHTHPWSDITSKPGLLGAMANPIFYPYANDVKLGAYISTINNRFYSADLRYTVTTTNLSGNVHYLFDDNYDNRMQIDMGTTATITIEGYNFIYNNGYIILYFYLYYAYPLLLPKSITAVATTLNGTTYTLNRATSVETQNTIAFLIGLEFLTKLEFTIVSLDNAYCGITNIDYFSRRTENTIRDCAVVTKYNANTLYHNLTAPKYIVSGGTSSQFLKADGSLDSTSYLPTTGGTLGGTSTIETELRLKSRATTLRLLAHPSTTNYIQSGNANFNGSVPLQITGYNGTVGSDLYLKFNNIYCRSGNYTNIDSGNYSNYALKVDGTNGTADGVSTLLNKLTTGSSTPTDADYYICQYAGGGTTTTSYVRRPVSALYTYIKNKLSLNPDERFIYATSATSNQYGTTEATGSSSTLTRTLFWRDNNRALIGIYVQHSDNLNYGFELASSYGPDALTYKRKFNGTWETIQTVLTSSNYNNYSPTLAGTGASGTWAINISGVAASASKVANALTIQLNGGTTTGTNKFVYDGSSTYTVNITPEAIGASATSHTHSYLPLSGGILGSSTASFTDLFIKSSTAKLRLTSFTDSTNYIQSGNSDFTGNATLKITGYNNTTGTNLYFNFANIYCRGGSYTNIDSGNYSSYALPLSGGTLTGTLISRDIRPSANVSYSLGTSSYYYNYVYANYFKKNGSSDSYVLLGGGGHKAVSDFAPNNVATLSSSGMSNSDLWTLVFEQSYPASYWYDPTTMFYIHGGTTGCGILCFYNYWNSATKLNAYEKEVWFFGAGKSETSATFGGANRDINDYLRIYIDTANFKYYIYYNRYNNLSLRIQELQFNVVANPNYANGSLRSSFFTNSTTVVNLPTESSTLVRVPIKTTYNHDRTIKTSKSIYASSFYENSDIRLKENVQRIDLSDLTKLVDLVQFNFKDSDTKKYGVIAQLLELVGLQNLVYENDGKKAVDYISLLVLEIQRLRNEIGELKLEINKKS